MTITVTWDDGTGTPTTFTMPPDVVAALDAYRQTITEPTGEPGNMVATVVYPTVKAMIIGFLVQQCVTPALSAFPTAAIAAAGVTLAAAQAAVVQAQVAALPGWGE